MKRKRTIYISVSIVCLLIITLFLYVSTFIQPKITLTAQINQVSNEEYEKAMVQVMSTDSGIEKFRHINLKIKIITPFASINDVHIEKDSSEQYLIQPDLKNDDKIQVLGGGMSSDDKGTEYNEDITVYMKDMSENELRNIIGGLKVSILWNNICRNKGNSILYVKDYLK